MDRFNLARTVDEKIESVLDMVAVYPVAAPRGPLNRDQTRDMIREDRARTLGAAPVSQEFATLDQTHAVCVETWTLRDSEEPLHRWTRLMKKGPDWLIESIEEGSAE
jgi:hypothetical protein